MGFQITPPLLNEKSVLNQYDKEKLLKEYIRQGSAAWERAAGDDPLDERRLKRVNYTYDELIAQPEKIKETIVSEKDTVKEVVARLIKRRINRIYMVGCGDSIAAMRGTRYFLEILLGIPCEEVEALDFAYYYHHTLDENSLVITLSSSGTTLRVLEAMYVARAAGAQTLALSNTIDSILMKEATAGIMIHAERKGWPTQSSTSAMALIIEFALSLAEALGRDQDMVYRMRREFEAIPDKMAEVINNSDKIIRKWAKDNCNKQMYLFCGGGPFYTCAEYGAAKVKEATPDYANAIPLEEYHHYNSQKEGDPLFLIAPSGFSTYRALETIYAGHSMGGKIYVLTNEKEKELIQEADESLILPEAPEYLANFLFSIPVQLLGYYISQEQIARAKEK